MHETKSMRIKGKRACKYVSMSMIADKVGIKKPSLYKHFTSKEEMVDAMYGDIRRQAKENAV